MRAAALGRRAAAPPHRPARGPPPLAAWGRRAADAASPLNECVIAAGSSKDAWPRALRGSLCATHTVVVERAPPHAVAADPARFPLAGMFTVDRGGPTGSNVVLPAADVGSMFSRIVGDDRVARIRQVAAARRFCVLPVVETLFDRGNLGAVCRSADAFGLGAVWVADIATDRFRPTRARCSAGAEKWLDLQVHQSTEDCIAALRARGFRVAVARAGPGAVPASDVDWTVPTAFIMGNEARGVSEAAQAAADFGVCIPMVGFAESLNVSVAAALLMGAARAQLDAAGAGRLAPAQAEALAAAMLLRHKGQQGRAGQAWQAPLVRGLALRGGG